MSRRIVIVSVASALLLGSGCELLQNQGQSGTEIPDGCYETSRFAVTDPGEVPEGFDFSFGDVLAVVEGTWTGTITLGGNGMTADLALAWTGEPVDASVREWVEHSGTTEGPIPLGAPDDPNTCTNAYDIPVTASLDAAPYATADIPVRIGAEPHLETGDQRDAFTVWGDVDWADVTGSAEPDFDPADWDHVQFGFYADGTTGTLTGMLRWTGTRDGSGDPNTVEPSITSTAGALELTAP